MVQKIPQKLPSDTEKTSGYSTDSSISSLGRIRRRAGRRVQRARKNSELSRLDSGSEFSLSEFSEMSLSESDRSESRSRPPSSLSNTSKRTRRGKRGGKKHQRAEPLKSIDSKDVEKETFVNEWVRKTTNDSSDQMRSSLDDVIEEGINDDEMEVDDVMMTSASTSGSGSICSESSNQKTGSETGNSGFESITTGSDDLDWADEMVEDDHKDNHPVQTAVNRLGTPLPEETDDMDTRFVSLSRPVSQEPQKATPVELPVLPVPASYVGAAKRISDSERMEIINRKLVQMKEEQKLAEEEQKRSRGHVAVVGRRKNTGRKNR